MCTFPNAGLYQLSMSQLASLLQLQLTSAQGILYTCIMGEQVEMVLCSCSYFMHSHNYSFQVSVTAYYEGPGMTGPIGKLPSHFSHHNVLSLYIQVHGCDKELPSTHPKFLRLSTSVAQPFAISMQALGLLLLELLKCPALKMSSTAGPGT